jgi:hypothetical protein
MMSDPILGGVVLKAASAGFPAVIRRIQADRWENSKAIFLKRMKRGSITARLGDRAAYNTWLYFRAAADGAAARNLELIAQAVRSDIDEPTLIAEDMKRVMDALATLTREEAIILGTAVRAVGMHERGELEGDKVWIYIRDTMVANPLFGSPAAFGAHAYALIRTGWIVPVSTYGGESLQPTPRLSVVARMVDFNDPDVVAP